MPWFKKQSQDDLRRSIEKQVQAVLPSRFRLVPSEDRDLGLFSWCIETPESADGAPDYYGLQILSENRCLFSYGLEAHTRWDFAARPALLIDTRLDDLGDILNRCFADPDRFPPNRVYLT